MAKPTIEAITRETLPEFAGFLAANMPASRTAKDWIAGLETNWGAERPNYGFLMRDDGRVVGGIGAYYADRDVRGRIEHFCNITSWCVLDSHRKYSMQLAMSLTGQAGYHFTDFSPTNIVAGALQFLKFKALDEAVAVIPNLHIFPSAGRVVTNPDAIGEELTGSLARIFQDHCAFPWLKILLVGGPAEWCMVIYKRSRFKGMNCASILFTSDGRLLSKYLNRLACHLFWQGMLTTHVERRMLAHLPKLAHVRTGFNPKQYLSDSLEASDIDYLYSETVALDL